VNFFKTQCIHIVDILFYIMIN